MQLRLKIVNIVAVFGANVLNYKASKAFEKGEEMSIMLEEMSRHTALVGSINI